MDSNQAKNNKTINQDEFESFKRPACFQGGSLVVKVLNKLSYYFFDIWFLFCLGLYSDVNLIQVRDKYYCRTGLLIAKNKEGAILLLRLIQ